VTDDDGVFTYKIRVLTIISLSKFGAPFSWASKLGRFLKCSTWITASWYHRSSHWHSTQYKHWKPARWQFGTFTTGDV